MHFNYFLLYPLIWLIIKMENKILSKNKVIKKYSFSYFDQLNLILFSQLQLFFSYYFYSYLLYFPIYLFISFIIAIIIIVTTHLIIVTIFSHFYLILRFDLL